ncbi:MAG TPA: site-2 protease family protein, partial [Kofleriaceae bacterium]|nr:site-2 protease family protein [Kofleriaceae bacterium]
MEAAQEAQERPNYLLHAGLFLATCATTWLAGGAAFAATLMAILLVHEMGHYVAARLHRVDASLPYFIPLPPVISLGTMGAVIRMKKPIEDRNALLDVGAAGPLAGLLVAIPLLVIGVALSPVSTAPSGGVQEGNSIAYLLLKLAVTGRILPAADGTDIDLNGMAFAAWVGLLVTMINLIPIGQLDGGHVARAYLGNRHERFSTVLHALL